MQRPVKVVIVGGGVGAMSAAWALSAPELEGAFDLTVYQLGWRLGGKGASGRDAAHHQRILEHGLHMFLGFYDNAFRMIQECYRELNRPAHHPMRDWTQAFKKTSYISLAEHHRGLWRYVSAHFPEDDRVPGSAHGGEGLTVHAFLKRAGALALELLDALYLGKPFPSAEVLHPRPDAPLGVGTAFRIVAGKLRTSLQTAALSGLLSALHSLTRLLDATKTSTPRMEEDLGDIRLFLEQHIDSFLEGEHEVRRVWELVALVLAALHGVLAHGLHRRNSWRDWEAIDDYDLRDWLRIHGAPKSALNNAILKGVYDIAFAYEDGKPDRPRYAAGQALRAVARFFFDYKGAPFWEMQAGMGDVVFAPLYLALRQRNVKFRFFHKLTSVGLSADKSAVDQLVFAKQVPGNIADYEPLVTVKGLECWPSEPKWDLIAGGNIPGAKLESQRDQTRFEELVLTAHAGDFEHVVLGIGVACIPFAAKELLCNQRWQDMVHHLRTVRTQSLQLWLSVGREQLGWSHPKTHLSAYVEPFDSWSDMTHLARTEDWPGSAGLRSIAYFVNAMPSEPDEQEQIELGGQLPDAEVARQAVKRNALAFLRSDVGLLWPKAATSHPDEFRWELLLDGRDGTEREVAGRTRLDAQYWKANTDPSDRYTACLPGTTRYRVAPQDTGFRRLTIAGDWTWNALNVGCVEAAVTSGLLAANAISRGVAVKHIVGLGREFEPEDLRQELVRTGDGDDSSPEVQQAVAEARRIVTHLSEEGARYLRAEEASYREEVRELRSGIRHSEVADVLHAALLGFGDRVAGRRPDTTGQQMRLLRALPCRAGARTCAEFTLWRPVLPETALDASDLYLVATAGSTIARDRVELSVRSHRERDLLVFTVDVPEASSPGIYRCLISCSTDPALAAVVELPVQATPFASRS